MKKMFFVALLALATGFFNSACAQFRKIPAEVTNAFSEKYGTATNVEWKDHLSAFAAGFELDGNKYDAKFNRKGEWLSTEKLIEISDLPDAVNSGLEVSKYSGWEVKNVYEIELPDDVFQYRLRVAKSDLHQKNLLFSNKGKLLKDNLTL